MRSFRSGWVIAFVLLFTSLSLAQVVNKKFTPEEIKKMTETRAVIETKLGNIELRFFPDVAPNHVQNFIDLAKKGILRRDNLPQSNPRVHDSGGRPQHKKSGSLRAWVRRARVYSEGGV